MNHKAYAPSDFSLLIGIDWADQKHDFCETNPLGENETYGTISAKPEGIHDWVMSLQKRFPHQQIAIACELKKGPLIHALLKYEFITLFTINPITVARYRGAFKPSGAKDDPSDARIQAQILRLHMSELQPIEPDTPEVRALDRLVEMRRRLVQDRVKLTNRITSTLKSYYPHVLDWFNEKDTIIFAEFLLKWPSLVKAQRVYAKTFRNFFNEHNARYTDVNERRIEAIKAAMPLTNDKGIIEPNELITQLLATQLKQLIEAIHTLDKEISKRYRKMADRKVFDSFPGAGPQLAPRLLVAFGSNRDRFQSANDVQKFGGISPVIERSGKKMWTHWRYSCPTFIRQTFVEWAGQSIRYSFWARAHYEQQIERGKTHQMAIRSLAFKWIRIAFACWKTNTPYDENQYLESLRKRGSSLLAYAVAR